MDLTVADLAHAVGRSENYIRQHIHRKHLIARRVGRNVIVTLDEASRWARKRGLAFVSPEPVVTTGAMKHRTARMTVLTWQETRAQPINLFTLIRHRRRDALGPWATQPDGNWSRDDLGEGLRQFTLDTSFDHCQALVDQITATETMAMDGTDVRYALERVPRRHWAYRNEIRPFTTSYAVLLYDTVPKSSSTGVSRRSLETAGWTCLGHFPPARGLSSLTWASRSTDARIALAIS